MKTFSLRKYDSKDFPIVAIGKSYENVFPSKDDAILSLRARFGDVKIIDNTSKNVYGRSDKGR